MWTLFAPGSRLRIYPDSHPHQTHTFPAPHLRPEGELEGCAPFRLEEAGHVAWNDELSASSAASGSSRRLPLPLPAYRVELRAGEVLLVPPGWSHHVSSPATARSLSLNVWSNTREYLLMRELKALELPLDPMWDTGVRVAAAMVFAEQLVTRVDAILRGKEPRASGATAPPSVFATWVERWLVAPRFHPAIMRTLLSNAQARTKAGRAEAAAVAAQCGSADPTSPEKADIAVAVRRAHHRWSRPDVAASGAHQQWAMMLEQELLPRFADIAHEAQPVDPTSAAGILPATDLQEPASASASAFSSSSAAAEMDLLIRAQGLHLTHTLLANWIEAMVVQLLDEDSRLMVHFMHRCLGAVAAADD